MTDVFYLTRENGGETLLREAFERMVYDRTLKKTFYDGTVTCVEEFVRDLLRAGSLPYAVFHKGKLAAIAWLNTIEGRTARGHFVFFSEMWGKGRPVAIGREILKTWLGYRDDRGYLFDAIIGWTPVSNRLALAGILGCGARRVGAIPHGAWMFYENRSEEAIVTVATREILEESHENL